VIDIILGVVFGGFALAATFMLPSKDKIQNNQAPKYKSYKNIIYAAGFGAIIGGVIFLLLYVMDETYQNILNMLKMAFLMVIGIVLITSNNKRSKFMAECEAAGYMQPGIVAPQSMQGMPQTPVQQQYVQPGVPQTVQQVPVQQIGVKSQQAVQAQTAAVQTVPAQQIGIKGQPQAAVQPTQVAAQPQQAAQPAAAQQPKILVINCPRCKGKMQIDTRLLGQKMKCPHCGIEGKIG
jgi:predicted RNA-binding Zn-ribbon protein involved in translation (DUF1610 family)